MAVVYDTALKTDRMQLVVDAIDAGPGPGKLKIGTTGMALTLATVTLTDPCGTVSGDTLTFDFDPDISVVVSNSGDPAEAVIVDSTDATVVSGLTVGTAGTNIILDAATLTAGQTLTVRTGAIQHG